ncbi:MAG: plasmid mobilization relaxosome protein MobC [Sphingobacteriales bacterium]|nr:plasmid mobilization relaxosome protein MobC [Sphingobacteriales bacterium]OJW00175.1 MAG: hypothetical protein BGO52_03550 [Sphingobacteriales bacterium 44-61]
MKKSATKVNLTRRVTVRFKPEEYHKIERLFKTTTKRKISEYIRSVLLEKPVTVYTRDQSMDEGMMVLRQLKKELSAIGNNYNQAVKKLHILDQFPELKWWVQHTENQRQLVLQKTEEINRSIHQLFDQWLRE